MSSLTAQSLPGLPEIHAGDDLAGLIVQALHDEQPLATPLHDGQIVVVAHKAVSKAEGAVVELGGVTLRARTGARAEQDKDARAVQVVLDQSARSPRRSGVLISRTRHGFVCANAGVDASNAGGRGRAGRPTLIVLPRDPTPRRARCARACASYGRLAAVLITALRSRLAPRAMRRRARLRGMCRSRTGAGAPTRSAWSARHLIASPTPPPRAPTSPAQGSREPSC